MLKRDSLTAQMQQLSHTLAKVKRLILDNEPVEAAQAIESVLGHYYGTRVADLVTTPNDAFEQQLIEQGFAAEELARLADFIDLGAQVHAAPASRRSLWEKVIRVYDVLEEVHQAVSFDHIMRRTELLALIENDGER